MKYGKGYATLKKMVFERKHNMKTKKIAICLLLIACLCLWGGGLTIKASNAGNPPAEENPSDTDGQTATGNPLGTGDKTAVEKKPEETWPGAPQIIGNNAIVMELNSGTVLYEKNSHEHQYPASTTKILTALLAIENSRLEEQVTFSYNSVHQTEGSGIWRDVDEVMTMEQCLYALMLNSANECAYAIAEHVGGTYQDFVDKMNERAADLGCVDTHFNNPHGLTDEQHYTSCYDMALIAREAMKNDLFRQITATKRYNIPPTNKHPDEITYLTNHHKMLWQGEKYYYEYCIGGKTGYTEAAGNTLVTFAQKDGMTLVCVVMKEKPTEQYEDSIKLLNYGFDNFRTYNIAEHMETDEKSEQTAGDFLSGGVYADIDKEAVIVLPKDVEFSSAKMEIVDEPKSKETAGILQYTYAGHVVGSVGVERTEAKVEKYDFHEVEPPGGAEEPVEKKVVRVNVKGILLIIAGLLAVAAAGFGIYRWRDYLNRTRYPRGRRRSGYGSSTGRQRGRYGSSAGGRRGGDRFSSRRRRRRRR